MTLRTISCGKVVEVAIMAITSQKIRHIRVASPMKAENYFVWQQPTATPP